MTQPSQVVSTASIPHVAVINGVAKTTSLQVAEFFGKRHDDILKKIRIIKQDCSEELHARNFADMHQTVATHNGGTRKVPVVQMTKDGFTLLVMGFTGKEAMQFKIAYITRFNEMEAALLAKHQAAPKISRATITPEQRAELMEIVSRRAGGSGKLRRQLWGGHNRHFRITEYKDLLAVHFEEAKDFLEHMELREQRQHEDAPDFLSVPEVMQESRDFLFQFMQNVNAVAPGVKIPAIDSERLSQGLMASLLTNQRFVMSYDHNLRLTLTAINSADRLVNPGNLENMLALVEQAVPEEALADIITACARRMAKVSACRDLKPGR